MHPNAALIEKFYRAFQQRDAATMVSCYHPDVRFSDPVFSDLRGSCAGDMWKMLCERGKDLKIEFRDVQADERTGAAHWEAWYTFSTTGRKVHNIIDARFEFRDGLIARHADTFDLYRWSRQALGAAGLALGWTGFMQAKIQDMAAKGLDEYIGRRAHPVD